MNVEVSVCVCVCVCLSKEKRKKMNERKERAGQKREERWVKMSGGEWGKVGAHVVHTKKKMLTFTFFFKSEWDVTRCLCDACARHD